MGISVSPSEDWRKAIGEKGWAVPTWPKELGGGGLSKGEARVLQQEMARIGAFNPLLFGMGITMIGPTIMDYGTEAQKKQHIPPIARGEVQWCVGYSEPNAGSDLASLQTRCDDAGDHWNIAGSKIWTSGAQNSHWCGALVRTDFSAKKHEGISFILIDMRQPAITTQPIKLISGEIQYAILHGGLLSPALSVRVTGSRTIDAAAYSLDQYGAELLLSKGFTVLTPYVGAGFVRSK